MQSRSFLKRLAAEWSEDALGDTAAALAYYGMLALFPFLVVVVALVGLVLDPAHLRSLLGQLSLVAPPPVTELIGGQLESLLRGPHSSILTVGALTAVWAASDGMSALIDALVRCYDLKETRSFLRRRALALGATLVAGLAGVAAVAVTFVLPLIGSWAENQNWIGGWLVSAISWARFPVAGLIVLAVWAFLYWALPNVRRPFQLLSPGSLLGMTLWLLASWGFSEYVRHFGSYQATYGALGGIIVLLLWMWLSSVTLLLGAEVNKILGQGRPATKKAHRLPQPEPA